MEPLRPLSVAVAEDEPLAMARIRRLLQEAGCSVVAEFGQGQPLLEWLEAKPPLDALFLDIQMPGPSGLDIAAELPFPVPVVFVTAFREHALAAFDLAALDYILKPVSAARLQVAIQRIREGKIPARSGTEIREALQPPAKVVIRAGEGVVFVDPEKITHLELEGETVYAHVPGQRLPTQWKTLSEAEAHFSEANLLRIQRHLLVRCDRIVGLRPLPGGRAEARMLGGADLEVSRSATARLRELLGIRGEFGKG